MHVCTPSHRSDTVANKLYCLLDRWEPTTQPSASFLLCSAFIVLGFVCGPQSRAALGSTSHSAREGEEFLTVQLGKRKDKEK